MQNTKCTEPNARDETRIARAFCLLCFALPVWNCPARAAEPTPTAILRGGKTFSASLTHATAEGTLALENDGQRQELALRDLVAWGAPAEARRGPHIVLADGGLLVADVLGLSDERLQLDSALLHKLALPLDQVAGIVFHPPLDAGRREGLQERIRAHAEKKDLLILDNGDEIAGTLLNISADEIEVDAAVGKLTLKIDRVVAVAFDSSLLQPPAAKGLRTLVGLADGSLLQVVSLAVAGGKAQITLLAGPRAETSTEQLVFLQPLGGGVTYLSDLKPTGYKHVPFLELPWEYRLDRSVPGTALRHGQRMYPKGIGMHSASRLTLPLSGRHKRFAAELALDAAAGGRGSVVFRVFVDTEAKYVSPVVRGGDVPLPIAIDLPSDARSLSLIVDFADRGDELDYANWLNARLEE